MKDARPELRRHHPFSRHPPARPAGDGWKNPFLHPIALAVDPRAIAFGRRVCPRPSWPAAEPAIQLWTGRLDGRVKPDHDAQKAKPAQRFSRAQRGAFVAASSKLARVQMRLPWRGVAAGAAPTRSRQ